jgi:magnesium-transporting ATPase (P-type)
VVQGLNADGLRVIAIAYRLLAPDENALTDPALERGLVLVGYIAFFDPPKESAPAAIAALARHGVAVKVLSGDNAAVCAHVCKLVGIDAGVLMDGAQVDRLDDAALGQAAARASVFAKLTPEQKTRVIRALQRKEHVVGFLGDGINDGPALKSADVGIYATFALLWFELAASHDAALFQTGWFVESLLSQTLIVYVIRTSTVPTLANRPSGALLAATLLVCAAGLWLPNSPLALLLGFKPLPGAYWWGLGAILLAYATVTQLAKSWLIRRFGIG